MRLIFIGVTILFLSSCVQHTESNEQEVHYTKQIDTEVKYAEGFNVDISDSNFTKIAISTNNSIHSFSDSVFIAHTNQFKGAGRKLISDNYASLALQSSTYLAYLDVLGKLDLVKGISGLEYVNSDYFNEVLKLNGTKELSPNGSLNMETLMSIQPELFLIYPFELDNQEKYAEKGIQTLLISEYLESTALGRLEWIKVFGLLLGDYSRAETYFLETEKKYFVQTQPVDSTKTLFFNLPFKDNWNMPSSNSITANMANDAGFNYIYSDLLADNAVRAKEKVWNDAMQCEYWIIIASRPNGFTLNNLMAEDDIYKEFPAVKNNKVIFCNTSTTEYFTKGVVEPDILLSELIAAKDGRELADSKYFKILQ